MRGRHFSQATNGWMEAPGESQRSQVLSTANRRVFGLLMLKRWMLDKTDDMSVEIQIYPSVLYGFTAFRRLLKCSASGPKV